MVWRWEVCTIWHGFGQLKCRFIRYRLEEELDVLGMTTTLISHYNLIIHSSSSLSPQLVLHPDCSMAPFSACLSSSSSLFLLSISQMMHSSAGT